MQDYSKLTAEAGDKLVAQSNQASSAIVEQNKLLIGAQAQAEAKIQQSIERTKGSIDESVQISKSIEALKILRASEKRRLESEILPAATADLISLNERTRAARQETNQAYNAYASNPEFANPGFMTQIKEELGIVTPRLEAQQRVKMAEEEFKRLVGQRDILENTISDTSTLVNDRLLTDANLLQHTADLQNRLTVNQADKAKENLTIKSINTGVEFATRIAKLNEASLNSLMNSSSTAYKTRVTSVNAQWQQTKDNVARADRKEALIDRKEARADRKELKEAVHLQKRQALLVRQADALSKQANSGALEYQSLATGVVGLGRFSSPELENSVLNLGSAQVSANRFARDLSTMYSQISTNADGRPTKEQTAKLDKLLELNGNAQAEYSTLRANTYEQFTTAKLASTKASAESAKEHLSNVNALLTAGGSTTVDSIAELAPRGKAYSNYVNGLAAKFPAGGETDPLYFVAAGNALESVGNIKEMATILGPNAAERILGEAVTEVYSTVNRAVSDIRLTSNISGSAATQQALINDQLTRDASVAQLNALNPSASVPRSELNKLFQYTAKDFSIMENNPLAQSLSTVVKNSGGVLTVDTLTDVAIASVKTQTDKGVQYSRALANTAQKLSDIMGAAYRAKPDLYSLGLGAADAPIITKIINRNGTTKAPIDLSNPSHMIKLLLESSKEFKSPRWFFDEVEGTNRNESPTLKALEFVGQE